MPSSAAEDDASVSCSQNSSDESAQSADSDSYDGMIKDSDESDSMSVVSSDDEGNHSDDADTTDAKTMRLWNDIVTLIASGDDASLKDTKFLDANKKLESLETLYTKICQWGGPNNRLVRFMRQMRLRGVCRVRVETPFTGKGESGSEPIVCALTNNALNRQNGVRMACVGAEGKVLFHVVVLKSYLPIIENAVMVFQLFDVVQSILQVDGGVFCKQSPEAVGQLSMPLFRRPAATFNDSFSANLMRVVDKGCTVFNTLLAADSSVFASSHPL